MLRKALRKGEALASHLGLIQSDPTSGFEVQFGPDGASVLKQSSFVSGIAFQRREVAKPGAFGAVVVSEQLSIERGAIVYNSMHYTRWRDFKEKISFLFEPLLETILSGSSLYAIRLEYRDRFNYFGDLAEAAPSELLREGSRLVAPHVFSQTGMWHSHTGMFEEAPATPRRLVQIAIDATDHKESDREWRSVSLMTGLEDRFQVEGLDAPDQEPSTILVRFDDLHTKSKALFKELLTDERLKQIGLT